jgi:hypothetical protein
MKTFRIQFLAGIFCLSITQVVAQDDMGGKFEKFRTQKIAYITAQLELTQKEAEVFWPVYNEYDEKKEDINIERLKLARKYLRNANTMTDKEASDLADKYVLLQKQEADLAAEYNKKFKEVISAKKVLKLYQAELQFKRKLLKQLRQGGFKGRQEGSGGQEHNQELE